MGKEKTAPSLSLEEVALDQLKPHPRNYHEHPDDEIDHLIESLHSNSVYRNIVIAHDGTILAGHGVVEAARRLGMQTIPAHRTAYPPDDPRALKLLVSDNTISHLAMSDDRALTELLRELKDHDDLSGLLGTGYDEMMLANLLMVSRPASEIADLDAASHWVGLPEYDEEDEHRSQIIVNFASDDDRRSFCDLLQLAHEKLRGSSDDGRRLWSRSVWWPPRERKGRSSLRFIERREDDD